MLVVETQTTTEDLLEGGTLAAEAGESAFAVSEEEHVAETAGNGLVYRFVKRAFDIAFSLCVVVVGLAPIALLLLIIRLESPGSPIYRQERIGYRGQPLRIFKLRTMVADSDDVEKHLSPEQLAQWRSERKVEDDPRVTRVGRFLRRTSLASVIIGTPGDGESTKSLSRSANSSLDLQLRGYAEGCSSFLSISKAVRCNDGGECCRRVA